MKKESLMKIITLFCTLLFILSCSDKYEDLVNDSLSENNSSIQEKDVTTQVSQSSSEDHAHSDSAASSLFLDGALASEITSETCTLSDGTETTCYRITIAGFPSNNEVGPFCPATTSTSADEAGIWFDGDALYHADGDFIVNLSELYNDDNWKLYNDDGTVNITDTQEAFEAAARPDVDEAYQNYCVEGRIEWLDNGEPIETTVLIPSTPVSAGSSFQMPGRIGVTFNGVIIEGSAPVDAILGAYTIAAFDDCGGHLNPFVGYHQHAATGCSEVGEADHGETKAFAYALDGYMIHSPYTESEEPSDLDTCNGHTTDKLGYHYHANQAAKNAVLNCFMGEIEISSAGTAGGPPGGNGPGLSEAAEKLGITEEELRNALGGPPPDFEAAAKILGLSVEELMQAIPRP